MANKEGNFSNVAAVAMAAEDMTIAEVVAVVIKRKGIEDC
jgi:hypothetical protein